MSDDSTRDSESSSIAGLLHQLADTPAVSLPPQLLASGVVVDGRFRIDRLLGQGGTAIVYVAHDLEAGRDVALKVGNAESEDGIRRVRREAQALAKLAHDSVIRVHAVGSIGERMYIAMELVGGGNARAWLAQPRTWRDIVQFFAAAGDGLAAAHAAGFVHRDVKPDNILVDRDRPRVADFGLVAAREAPPSTAFVALTRTGAIMGTPAYMAPEQLAGEVVDARADQFSLCAAIWEALFGSPPFPGANMASIAAKLVAGEVQPPADTRGVPPRIVEALRRGLAIAKADRWPSVAALVRELRRASRRRWPVVVAALAIAGLAAGVAAFAMTPMRSHPSVAAGDEHTWRIAGTATTIVGHGRPLAFDPHRVELAPFLAWALALVRDHVPDAELARISIHNVRRDGTADLTQRRPHNGLPASLELRFASKARAGRADCMQSITATAKDIELDLEFSICDEAPVPMPRCTPSLVWYLLANQAGLPKDTLVDEAYYAGFGPAWFVDSNGHDERFPDACY